MDETEQSYKSKWKQISVTHHLSSVCLGWHFSLSLWHITDSITTLPVLTGMTGCLGSSTKQEELLFWLTLCRATLFTQKHHVGLQQSSCRSKYQTLHIRKQFRHNLNLQCKKERLQFESGVGFDIMRFIIQLSVILNRSEMHDINSMKKKKFFAFIKWNFIHTLYFCSHKEWDELVNSAEHIYVPSRGLKKCFGGFVL